MYPTHNPDGTCTKEYFEAVIAVRLMLEFRTEFGIYDDWQNEFVEVWMEHVKSIADQKGYVVQEVAWRLIKLIPKEDSDASRANR